MFTCEECGKKFKSGQALGGHMRNAHWQGSVENADNEPEQVTESPPPAGADDPGVLDRIRDLYREGYSPKAIRDKFGYHPSSVDKVGKEFIQPDQPKENNQRDSRALVRKEKESVLPEWLEREVAEVFDGDKRDQKIFMAGMSVPLLGLRLFGEAVDPLTKLMSTWQEGQARLLEAMQGSSAEAAQRAAAMAGAQVMSHIDQKFAEAQGRKKDIAEVQDPMKGLLARTMETIMNQITGQMFGGGQNLAGPTPGMVDKRQQGGG